MAAQQGASKLVRLLLAHDADVDKLNHNWHDSTALMAAAERGQVQRGLAPPGFGLEVSLELDEPLGRLDVAAVPIRGPKA